MKPKLSNLPAPVYTIGRGLLDLVMPAHCLNCDSPLRENTLLCTECAGHFRLIKEPRCPRCGKAVGEFSTAAEKRCSECVRYSPAFDQATAPLAYDDVVRELILKLKFLRKPVVAECFTTPLADHLASMVWMADVDLVQPVPMHWWRCFRRGYNQAELLAGTICRTFGIPMTNALRRIRLTRPQSRLSRRSRLRNLEGAMKVKPKDAVEGKTILVVDDILTTGTTGSVCADVLKEAGADKVYVLTVARA